MNRIKRIIYMLCSQIPDVWEMSKYENVGFYIYGSDKITIFSKQNRSIRKLMKENNI